MSHHHNTNEHFVTLLSNNSMEWYPQNSLSSFTNNLPVGLGLDSDWVVGVSDLYIPNFDVIEHQDKAENKTTELKIGGKKYVYHIRDRVVINLPDEQKIKTVIMYCDIIKPRMVGDSFIKCLRMLHVKQEAQYITFPRVEYHPLSSFCFCDITILFKDDIGNQIKFHESYKPTSCTLHFKKIRQ